MYRTAAASLAATLQQWLGRAPGCGAPTALQMSPEEHAQTAHAMARALQQLVSLAADAPAVQPAGAAHIASHAADVHAAHPDACAVRDAQPVTTPAAAAAAPAAAAVHRLQPQQAAVLSSGVAMQPAQVPLQQPQQSTTPPPVHAVFRPPVCLPSALPQSSTADQCREQAGTRTPALHRAPPADCADALANQQSGEQRSDNQVWKLSNMACITVISFVI